MHQLLALAAQLQISLSPEAASAGERLAAGERHPESLDTETLADMQVAVLGCTGLCWAALGCAGLYWAVLGCAGLYWAVLGTRLWWQWHGRRKIR